MGPSGEMCNNCNYFDKHPTEFLGHCKRFPPTIPPDLFIPRPSPSGELTQMEVEQKKWRWNKRNGYQQLSVKMIGVASTVQKIKCDTHYRAVANLYLVQPPYPLYTGSNFNDCSFRIPGVPFS